MYMRVQIHFCMLISFPLCKFLRVEWLGHMVDLFAYFWRLLFHSDCSLHNLFFHPHPSISIVTAGVPENTLGACITHSGQLEQPSYVTGGQTQQKRRATFSHAILSLVYFHFEHLLSVAILHTFSKGE